MIDLNPRFYVSLTVAAAAGLNLPAIWASLLLGLSFEASGYRAGVRFREELGDPQAILAELAGAGSNPCGISAHAAERSTRCSRSVTPARTEHPRRPHGGSETEGRALSRP